MGLGARLYGLLKFIMHTTGLCCSQGHHQYFTHDVNLYLTSFVFFSLL